MKRHYFLVIAALLASVTAAYADSRTISGETIDTSRNMLTIRQSDGDVFEVHWNDDFAANKALDDVEEGDSVSVEAEENEKGQWNITQVNEPKAAERAELKGEARSYSGRIQRHDAGNRKLSLESNLRWDENLKGADKLSGADNGQWVRVEAKEDPASGELLITKLKDDPQP